MPNSVVKTPEQEKLWNKAKAIAAKEGKGQDYAYIMGIYKKMGGMDKVASYLGALLGGDAIKAGRVTKQLQRQIVKTERSMRGARKTVSEPAGLFRRRKTTTPLHTENDVNKATEGLRSDLLKAQELEQDAVSKRRATRLGTAGALGAGAFALGNRGKGPYTETPSTQLPDQQPMYTYASEEKTAAFDARKILNHLKDIATGNEYKTISNKIKDISSKEAPASMSKEVKKMRDWNANLEKLRNKIQKRLDIIGKAEGKGKDPSEVIGNAMKEKIIPKNRAKDRHLNYYKEVTKKHSDLHDKLRGEYDTQMEDYSRQKRNALGKMILGYGGLGAGVAVGAKKVMDSKKKDQAQNEMNL